MTASVVTLTFDNGPTPGITEPVLEVLAARGVPATFFAIGSKLDTEHGRQLGRQIVAEGHRLGGHTWSHSVQFGVADDDVVGDELARTRAAVAGAGGDELLFRPYGAGGIIDDQLMSPFGATTLCSLGYTCVLWNVLPGDWRDAHGWIEPALGEIDKRTWSVIVLHDVADAAMDRLDDFLSAIQDRQPVWSQGFPDECTPIRYGSPTSSYATLSLSN